MNVNLRFGSRPKAISPGVERAAQGVVQSVQSLGQARTAAQVKKSGSRLVLRWVKLGFQLLGQGIGKRLSACFAG
ncbi:hypothetical protein [Vampirovibrio chlorellavorus]|uniref:hypothetical protein n=1 Tax=Vampirovibrio chlorellavorus TaxID=758823 RepID=UPI0026EDEDAF|nr:hypothetical protein [Vampirovibrio chlorellavorus]